jgi:hypothetical protein
MLRFSNFVLREVPLNYIDFSVEKIIFTERKSDRSSKMASENERREFKTEEDYESFLMKENQKIRRRERERRHVDDPGKERCDVCNSVISYEGSCTCCQDW